MRISRRRWFLSDALCNYPLWRIYIGNQNSPFRSAYRKLRSQETFGLVAILLIWNKLLHDQVLVIVIIAVKTTPNDFLKNYRIDDLFLRMTWYLRYLHRWGTKLLTDWLLMLVGVVNGVFDIFQWWEHHFLESVFWGLRRDACWTVANRKFKKSLFVVTFVGVSYLFEILFGHPISAW